MLGVRSCLMPAHQLVEPPTKRHVGVDLDSMQGIQAAAVRMTSLAVKVHSSAAVQVHTSVSFVVGRTVRKPLRLGLAAVNTCGVTARRPPHLLALVCYAKAGGQKGKQGSSRKTTSCQLIEVDPAGLDIWRLDAVIELLLEGGVGIIPTDTYPALVCDVTAKSAVQRLYTAADLAAKKPLSILCRGFSDISTYTMGLPASNGAGSQDIFRLARQALPGPFTLILRASKELPKQCVDLATGKSKTRRSVGVRMPDHQIAQAILSQMNRPLLCTSAHVHADDEIEFPEAAVLMDAYAERNLDFVVDAGPQLAEGSTVIDMTGPEPVLVRQGKGDPARFLL